MVKRLMKSIREFRGVSIKAPIFVSLEVVMEVVIPLIMADLIDRGINGGNMPYILKTRTCTAMCRSIPFPTSTSFPPAAWSRA